MWSAYKEIDRYFFAIKKYPGPNIIMANIMGPGFYSVKKKSAGKLFDEHGPSMYTLSRNDCSAGDSNKRKMIEVICKQYIIVIHHFTFFWQKNNSIKKKEIRRNSATKKENINPPPPCDQAYCPGADTGGGAPWPPLKFLFLPYLGVRFLANTCLCPLPRKILYPPLILPKFVCEYILILINSTSYINIYIYSINHGYIYIYNIYIFYIYHHTKAEKCSF